MTSQQLVPSDSRGSFADMKEFSAFFREEREHMKAELRESREEARAAQATLEARIEEMMAPKPALDDEQLTA